MLTQVVLHKLFGCFGVCSFTYHMFVHSFFHIFVHSFFHIFVHSVFHLFVHSFACVYFYSFFDIPLARNT